MKIKIEVDGRIIDIPVQNNAKIIVLDIINEEGADDLQLHLNVTHEGLITDLIDTYSDEIVGTSCKDFDEIITCLQQG